MIDDWSKYPNFSEEEFKCSHTGKCLMRPEFMDTLQQIRNVSQFPFIVSSGYRDPTHPVEAHKLAPGEHTYGVGVDILISGVQAQELIVLAYGHGIRRFGIAQKGEMAGRFIHLGMGDKQFNFPQAMWSY